MIGIVWANSLSLEKFPQTVILGLRWNRENRGSTHELNSRFVRNSQRQPFAKGNESSRRSRSPSRAKKSRAEPSRGPLRAAYDTAVVATKHSTTAEEVGARVPLSSVSATSRPKVRRGARRTDPDEHRIATSRRGFRARAVRQKSRRRNADRFSPIARRRHERERQAVDG